VARVSPEATEGLRSRKKRLLRQHISDTATSMFLDRGFDEVRVSEVAAACDVSEKTVYNYFPTKESLLFDREEAQTLLLSESLRDRGDGVGLVDSVLAALEGDTRSTFSEHRIGPSTPQALTTIRRFSQMIEDTPSLNVAVLAMMNRLSDVAARALAERAGVDPEDPEPQMAASVVMALWQTQMRAMRRYADGTMTAEEVQAGVIDDLRRAAKVADAGLSSFTAAVRSSTSKEQVREAAEAADAARRQVVAAMKQARTAWKQVMLEVQAHHRAGDEMARTKQEIRAQQHELRAEIRRRQQDLRRQQALLREQQARARARR